MNELIWNQIWYEINFNREYPDQTSMLVNERRIRRNTTVVDSLRIRIVYHRDRLRKNTVIYREKKRSFTVFVYGSGIRLFTESVMFDLGIYKKNLFIKCKLYWNHQIQLMVYDIISDSKFIQYLCWFNASIKTFNTFSGRELHQYFLINLNQYIMKRIPKYYFVY
jgi:hypothetical protein